MPMRYLPQFINGHNTGASDNGVSLALPAISLWQPWASFIAISLKPYETRSWPVPGKYLGRRIAIHAAKRPVDIADMIWWKLMSNDAPLPLGAVVCTAIIDGDFPADQVPPDDFGDYARGRRAWKLIDIQPIDPPIQARGRQGFWPWRPDAA